LIILAALYFVAVGTVAALAGQHLVRKLIALLGRASIIIFILALTVFVSGISLGKFLICFHFILGGFCFRYFVRVPVLLEIMTTKIYLVSLK